MGRPTAEPTAPRREHVNQGTDQEEAVSEPTSGCAGCSHPPSASPFTGSKQGRLPAQLTTQLGWHVHHQVPWTSLRSC